MLVAIGLLPLALLGAWGIEAVFKQQRRDLERATLDMSRALASAVNAEIDSTVSALETLTYHAALTDGRHEEFYGIAHTAVRARPYWASVILADSKGHMIFKTLLPFGSTDTRLIDPDSMERVLREKRPLVGHIRQGQTAGMAIPVRVPVLDGGRVQYVVTAALKPDRIRDILVRQAVPKGWVITVADARNVRVAYSRGHDDFVGKPITPTLARLIVAAPVEGTGTAITAHGVESIAGFTKLPRWGLSVTVGAPTSLFHGAFWNALAVYASGLLVALSACVAAATVISRRITRGMHRLQQQAGELGQGLPVRAGSHGIAEVDQLAKSLETASANRMTVEQQRESLLERLNQSLASLSVALEQAQEAARAKDHFLAVLGHELRNPLAPIVSTLDLMDARGNEVYQRERQILRRQVAHMHRLVDDLLDVSRIAQGKLSLDKQPLLLNALIERAHESLAAAGRSAPLSLVLPTEAVWVQGDETRLLQVVLNLLGNALRHAPGAPVTLSLSKSDALATVTVSDVGPGMTAQMLEQIFTPFYQGPQSIARSAGGLGLGLAIAHTIVTLHGGTLTAHSKGLGHGCQFHIALPLGAEARPVHLPKAVEQRRAPARIVVIDDNLDAAHVMADSLTAAGYDVRVGHSAAEALTLFSAFMPQVGILDIGLPDTDGLTLASGLRASEHGPNLALIALTGYGQLADKHRALEAGFDVHLTKPVSLDLLLHHIHTSLKMTKTASSRD